jgi:hypothetical protein
VNLTRVLIKGKGNAIEFYTTLNGKSHFTTRSDDADFLTDEQSFSEAKKISQAKGYYVRVAYLETDL